MLDYDRVLEKITSPPPPEQFKSQANNGLILSLGYVAGFWAVVLDYAQREDPTVALLVSGADLVHELFVFRSMRRLARHIQRS